MENIAILMPHRYFINKNLSMESEKLRSRIDEYSIKYESKIQSYKMEIERIQAENEQEYIKISESLINDFKQDSDSLDDLQKELLIPMSLICQSSNLKLLCVLLVVEFHLLD